MIKHLVVVAGLVALAPAPALAQDQAAIMKTKLAKPSTGIVQPTGIEVPGCSWYVLDDRRGGVRRYCDRADTRDPARFWDTGDYLGGGSTE